MRIGILISGRGSNMTAILQAIKNGRIRAEPAVVISSRADAKGLDTAKEFGVSTEVVKPEDYDGRESFDREVMARLIRHGVTADDLVCLAGFMRIIGPEFVSRYRGHILNIHPSLLPEFPGLHAQRQAIEAGAKKSGCTVHFVDEGVDTPNIIRQTEVDIAGGDTEETLSEKILPLEHDTYVLAVQDVVEGRVIYENGRVIRR